MTRKCRQNLNDDCCHTCEYFIGWGSICKKKNRSCVDNMEVARCERCEFCLEYKRFSYPINVVKVDTWLFPDSLVSK